MWRLSVTHIALYSKSLKASYTFYIIDHNKNVLVDLNEAMEEM